MIDKELSGEIFSGEQIVLIGITGTPGTGKTLVANELRFRGIPVLDLKTTVQDFILEHDDEIGADIIDIDAWAEQNTDIDGFVEGAIAHYLPCDKIIVLRCRPDILMRRLASRGYSERKVKENAEAEALDVILIEAVDAFPTEQIYEIDTTIINKNNVVDRILAFSEGKLSASFGSLDWSGYVVNL